MGIQTNIILGGLLIASLGGSVMYINMQNSKIDKLNIELSVAITNQEALKASVEKSNKELQDQLDREKIYQNKNKTLAKLHSVDYKKIGLEDYGKPGNYVARQVSRWSKQYRASETDDIEAMNNLIEWLPKNIPDDDETSIVHGDYRLDNMILKNNQVMGILDWELSTLGHPVADFSYHCLSWRNQEAFWDEAKLKDLGVPTENEYMEMYCENTGKDLSKNWEFYMAFNMFKIAGILQGILGRVRDGTAASKHAEERGMMVYPLSEAAWKIITDNF